LRSLPYQRFWLNLLGLDKYSIRYVKVNHRGVLDTETGRLNNSFVGCWMDRGQAVVWILHTRKLTEADLLHEFICQLHQDFVHQDIDPLCEKLIAARVEGNAQNLIRRHKLGLSRS